MYSQKLTEQLWVPPILIFTGYQGSFSGVWCLAHEVYPSSPYSAKVRNEQSYTSASLICLYVMHGDNFTLLPFL